MPLSLLKPPPLLLHITISQSALGAFIHTLRTHAPTSPRYHYRRMPVPHSCLPTCSTTTTSQCPRSSDTPIAPLTSLQLIHHLLLTGQSLESRTFTLWDEQASQHAQ